MEHRDLLSACVNIINSYDGGFLSPEDHLNGFLDSQRYEENDSTFISEVFSGLLRYRTIVNVVTEGFYNTAGKGVSLYDKTLLDVLTYTTLFRLEEITVPHYKRFVRSQDFNTMYKYCGHLFKEGSLKTWMRDEWSKLYDVAFVETNLVSPMLQNLPELHELLSELKSKVNAKKKPPTKVLKLTEIDEFNLTKPRPRSVPLPQPIPKLKPHKPVPNSVYKTPAEKHELENKKVENRRAAEQRLMESSKKQFACANPGKSMKTMGKINKIRQHEDNKLQFDSHKAKPLPTDIMQSDVPVKLNTAHIMREGRLFKQREQEVIKQLEKLEFGAHDPSKFLRWQTEMRQRDLEDELAAVERRRLEGMLSHEEAILARQNLVKENQRKVDDMKEETKEMMARYLDDRLEEEQLMRSLVETVMSGRENAKEAKKKLTQYKSKIVQEVNEESKELMRQALEEAEEEMKRKVELIHQIRAMEAAPVNRNKLVDFTETPGYGFLNEMSIVELRERLALLKEKEAAEEEQRRDEIIAGKQARDQLLIDTLTTISKHRAEDTRVRAKQRAESKYSTEDTKTKLLQSNEKLLSLQEKLDQRRAERLEMQTKTKIKPAPSSFDKMKSFTKERTKCEERRWSELEKSKKRLAGLRATKHPSNSRLTGADGSRLAVSSRPFIMT